MIFTYLLAFLLCLPISFAGAQGDAVGESQTRIEQALHDGHQQSKDCHHGTTVRIDKHECCEDDSSITAHKSDCDMNCEQCGCDLGSTSLAIMPDFVSLSLAVSPDNSFYSRSIPLPPHHSELIPPIA